MEEDIYKWYIYLGKGLISKNGSGLIKLPKKQATWLKNEQRTWIDIFFFSKKDIQMANRQMKRCSRPLIIRKMQIKITMRYYFTSVEWLLLKKKQQANDKYRKEVKKRAPLCALGGGVTSCSHHGKQWGGSSINQMRNYHMIQTFLF